MWTVKTASKTQLGMDINANIISIAFVPYWSTGALSPIDFFEKLALFLVKR